MDPEKAKPVNVRSQANLEPTGDPAMLKYWWYRDMASYSAYKVKRVGRQQIGDQDYLFFRLARNEALGPFKVDLAQGGDLVWAELPSTAQLATEERPYGFLFLSKKWAERNLKEADIPKLMDGGKWPTSGELERFVQELKRAMQDPNMKAELTNLFDTLATSIR